MDEFKRCIEEAVSASTAGSSSSSSSSSTSVGSQEARKDFQALQAELDASRQRCAEFKVFAEVSKKRAKELGEECESLRQKCAALERSE